MNTSKTWKVVQLYLLLAIGLSSPQIWGQQSEVSVECSEGIIAEPIDIAFGNYTTNCTIDTASDRDRFTEMAVANTTVRVSVLSLTSFFDPRLEIRDPEGDVIYTQSCSGQDPFGNGIRCSFQSQLDLPVDGNYDFSISDSGFNETGSYTMQLESIPPTTTPPLVGYDTLQADTVSPQTDTDYFRFFGLPGTVIRINVLSNSTFYDPRLEIFAPDGSFVSNNACVGQDPFGNGIRCSYAVEFEPEFEGEYLISFSDTSANESGAYQFSLFCLSGPCDSNGDGIPDSTSRDVNYVSTNDASLANATDGEFFRFYGHPGTDVRVDLASTSPFFDPVLQVRDSKGDTLSSGSCVGQDPFGNGIKCSFSINFTLPFSGFYDIAVFDSSNNEAGGFRFTLHCLFGTCDSDADGLIDPDPDALDYNISLQAPISPSTDLDRYLIQGTDGDDIVINLLSLTNFLDPRIELYSPDGTLLESAGCSGQDPFGNGIRCSVAMNETDLPETGLYRLFVYDISTNETGDYELGLQCVFGTCTNPPPPPSEGDNCIEFANGPLIPDAGGNVQLDTDGDGIGNSCDSDLNNDCVINFSDYSIITPLFLAADADADSNGDGLVNFQDISRMTQRFLYNFEVENPSGVPNICD